MSKTPAEAWNTLTLALGRMTQIDDEMKADGGSTSLDGERLIEWDKQADIALTALADLKKQSDVVVYISAVLERGYGEPT